MLFGSPQFVVEGAWVFDFAKVCVQDKISIIGDNWTCLFHCIPQLCFAANLFDLFHHWNSRRSKYFDGNSLARVISKKMRKGERKDYLLPVFAQKFALLFFVPNQNELFRVSDVDLLLEESASATLYQMQILVYLIRTVNCYIERWMSVKITERKVCIQY